MPLHLADPRLSTLFGPLGPLTDEAVSRLGHTPSLRVDLGDIPGFYRLDGEHLTLSEGLLDGSAEPSLLPLDRWRRALSCALEALALASLRQQVALLHEDQASIVAGTVADNLRFAQPSVSLLQMRDALVAASLWDEVSALPLGLDTPLLSGAPGWSPSMRWRLVLTRLLLQKPKLVLIDGLHDTEWELTPLLSMDAPWTLVWVSEAGHPLLHRCTSVYVVEQGVLRKTTPTVAAGEAAR